MLLRTAVEQKQDNRLSNMAREAMLQRGGDVAKAALVLDGLYALGWSVGACFRFDEAFVALSEAFGMSRRTIYYGLQDFVFFRRQDTDFAGRGRKPYLYKVPHPWLVHEHYASGTEKPNSKGNFWFGSDNLESGDLKSLRTYRIGLHREFIKRQAQKKSTASEGPRWFESSRDLQAERLGVCKRTVRRYDKELGTLIQPQFERQEIFTSNYFYLPVQQSEERREWLEVIDPRNPLLVVRLPLVRYLAYQFLMKGCRVWRVRQLVNRYAPNPDWYQQPVILEDEIAF